MEELNQFMPQAYHKYFALLVVVPYITRAYYSLRNGGGLKGVWNSIMFGTNHPVIKDDAADQERK